MDTREFLKTLGIAGLGIAVRPKAVAQALAELGGNAHPMDEKRPIELLADEKFPLPAGSIQFDIEALKDRIRAHESTKYGVYADSKDKPTIGVGFNMSVEEKLHGTDDPYQHNDHVRKDPSARLLWKYANVEPDFDAVLAHFHATPRHRVKHRKHGRHAAAGADPTDIPRNKEHPLNLSKQEAEDLFFLSTRQAINNAMAYCVDFPNMHASQQMAMCELVYQLGVELEGFHKFLEIVNDTSFRKPLFDSTAAAFIPGVQRDTSYPIPFQGKSDTRVVDHWKQVQTELANSRWCRQQAPERAKKVIAMMDPEYIAKPDTALSNVDKLKKDTSFVQKADVDKHKNAANSPRK